MISWNECDAQFAKHGERIARVERDGWMTLMDRALDEARLPADATSLLREFFHAMATFMINRSR